MDTLRSVKQSTGLWVITCTTPQESILSFLWDKFIQSTNDSITDYENETKINNRVAEKTDTLDKQSISLINKNKDLNNEILNKNSVITILNDKIEYMNKNHQEAISSTAINTMSSSKQLMDHLQEQIKNITLDKKELEYKFEQREKELNFIMEEKDILLNKTNNKSSYQNGVDGEMKLLELLREECSFTVNDTHGSSHKGDAEVIYNNMRLCIDAKQYQTTCPHKESTKLVEDVEKNSYDGGILISWDSGIYDPQTSSKIKDLICHKTINCKPYLFISLARLLPDELIISSIKELETNKLNNESFNNTQINDNILSELSNIVTNELKDIDASDKKIKIKTRRNDERRKQLNSLIKVYNLTHKKKDVSKTDNVTEIYDILTLISVEYKDQRNSVRDVKQYIEKYIDNNSISIFNLSEVDIKNALEMYKIVPSNKGGKNYVGKQRKKDTITWPIELINDL